MPIRVPSTCAHHQEVKIVLYSLWYHHTYRWSCRAQVERVLSEPAHDTATYRCDDTRGCVMQFWPPDDEHMCSKHIQAWNKLTVKQNFCASSWLITEINILRCMVSKTSKKNGNHGLKSDRQVAVRCRNATQRRSSSVKMATPLATCNLRVFMWLTLVYCTIFYYVLH